MANPEEIGPAYQCATCLAWGPAEVCATCEAEATIVVGVDYGVRDGDETVITVNGLDVDELNRDAFAGVVDLDELNPDAFAGVHNVEGRDFGPITFDSLRETVARLAAARILDRKRDLLELLEAHARESGRARRVVILATTPHYRDSRGVHFLRVPKEGGPPMAPPGKPDRDE